MHSFIRLVVVGGAVVRGVRSAVLPVSTPVVTPAPRISDVELLAKRQDPDAISLAQILLTAIPESLREIAATNVPAVSSILWEEFLDNNKPEWFLELPYEVQSYLIRKFGPSTAWYPATATDGPVETTQDQPSETGSAASSTGSAESSATQTPASSNSRGSTTLATSVASSATRSATGSSSDSLFNSSPSSTSTSEPDSPPASNSGLSQNQKIGIGVGVPLGILGGAALLFGCCFLLRRRRNTKDGSVPPSSPGFIPRFAFQEKSTENLEHRTPLNRDVNHSTHDLSHTDWDDDVIEPTHTQQPANAYTPVTMNDPKPIMAPALYHTHSSNRARGRRTSYTSLHSVAEVSEPDEMESPVLGRHVSPQQGHHRRTSSSRNLIPPPVPAVAQIKRKPVPTSPTPTSPAARAASNTLLRQTMPEHSGSSSSGLLLSTSSSSSGLGLGNHTEVTSPISPASDHAPKNPFANDYSYVEDYGPEYHNGYVDIDDGLYGGHTSLSRYPEPRKNSRTEWPLRNFVGSGHRRNKSPLWDRVYEG